jgi:Holliday junction DNA helicase RuvA
MIGSLRGTVLDRSLRGEVLIEVGGVGYRVTVPPATLAAVALHGAGAGAAILLHTSLQVREDALTLYGFGTRDERDCFEALVAAHGVGPALALAILSVHAPDQLRRVLMEGDLDALTLVPGVGRKTAARLLIELKSRLDLPEPGPVHDGNGHEGNGSVSTRTEVRAALAALGYDQAEVQEVLREIPVDGGVEDTLRGALRLLGAIR